MHLAASEAAIVSAILREHLPPGAAAYVFGSRAHGRKLRRFSDLDLCIRNDRPLSGGALAALREAFAQSDLPYRVDLVEWSMLTTAFRAAIEDDLMPLKLARSRLGRPRQPANRTSKSSRPAAP